MKNAYSHLLDLPAGETKIVETLVERFEQAWEKGQTPDLAPYLPHEQHLRPIVLQELVHIDLERRLKAGMAVQVQDYLQRYPELSKSAELLKDLQEAEKSWRERLNRSAHDQTIPHSSEASGQDTTDSGTPVDRNAEAVKFLAPAQLPDEIGRLGPYRILKVLGMGGMGMVFLAEDPKLKRQIALKTMKPEIAANAQAHQRFLREAQAAALLESDYIVPIHQVSEDRGVPFLAMPLLKGASLEDRLKTSGAMKPAQVIRLGIHIARGLAVAHEHGLVHRDIKPANLWLEPEAGGRIRILDFGLARDGAADTHLTQSGAIVGTPAYMAPEQAHAQPVDARCDLFSLGCVLYRMCTGVVPFKGETTMAILMALATKEPQPPHQINSAIPEALSHLIMQLLAKDPAKRPASAKEVVTKLQAIEKGGESQNIDATIPTAIIAPAEATTASWHPTFPFLNAIPSKRRPMVLAVAGTLFVSLIALAGVIFYWQSPNGLVRIEIDDDDIEVVLNKTGVVVKKADQGKDITLRAGSDHRITVRRADGFEFQTKDFVLKRNDKITLKVQVLEGKIQVVANDGTVLGSKLVNGEILPWGSLVLFNGKDLSGWKLRGSVTKNNWVVGSATLDENGKLVYNKEGNELVNTKASGIDIHTEQEFADCLVEFECMVPKGSNSGVYLMGRYEIQIQDSFGKKALSVTDMGAIYNFATPKVNVCKKPGEWQKFVIDFKAPRFQGKTKTAAAKFLRVELNGTVIHEDLEMTRGATQAGYGGEVPAGPLRLQGDHGPVAFRNIRITPKNHIDQAKDDREWLKLVGGFTPEKQVVSVVAKLKELNPGFDGKVTPKYAPDAVTGLEVKSDKVLDLTPLRTLAKLQTFTGRSKLGHDFNAEKDAALLRTFKSLEQINGKPVAQFWKEVDARKAEFEKWLNQIPILPAEQQLKEVMAKLKERNPSFDGKPGFDGVVRQKRILGGVVIEIGFNGQGLRDIAPLQALSGLRKLDIHSGPLADISPLSHLIKMNDLGLSHTSVSDLSPLKGLPLTKLELNLTQVTELSPLKDIKLVELSFDNTRVSDLSPLKKMPLKTLVLNGSPVSDLSPLKGMKPTRLGLGTKTVTDLSPLEGMPLISLDLRGSSVTDLTPLKGMTTLKILWLERTRVAELAPLKGINLTELTCTDTRVTDLTPLKDMPLRSLMLRNTTVTNLSPLKDMQTLTHLYLSGTKVNDVSPLKGLRLTTLELYGTNVSNLESLKDLNLKLLRINGTLVTDLTPIRGMPLTALSCDFKEERDAKILRSIKTLGEINGKSASQFWKEVDAGTYVSPAFDDAWIKQVAKMTAKEQVEAVRVHLMKRNPGFDGKLTHKIEDGEVTSLEFLTDQIIDIRPVRALARLQELTCNGTPGKGQLTDLTPLLDLKLAVLDCSNNKVNDLTPLQEMPLIDLRCDFNAARDAKILRSIKTLEMINGQPVEDFWNAVDQKKP